MGIQASQVHLFAERFSAEFSLLATQKLVLAHKNGLPYVVADALPCPSLGTIKALRWPEQNPMHCRRGM